MALAVGAVGDVEKSSPYSSYSSSSSSSSSILSSHLFLFSPPPPNLKTAAASRSLSRTPARRSLLTFGIGPAYPAGVGAATTTPGAAATPAAAASGGGGSSSSNNNNNNNNGAPTKLRTCGGPFEICPAPTLCRNPNKGNEWCYWLYVDKASCVCL